MPAHVRFLTETEDAAERFVREYGLGAVDRAEEIDGCHGVTFALTFANLGYSAAEEMEMYLFCIEEDLRIFAERNDEETVDAKIDELISSLEDMRGDVKDGRPSH
ncbi:hypothetical protein BRC73_07990 [Halobacteriales archaeon QH_7_66_37]|nr:MAG: hypothetical protein BRC73_07990 [Halobacteriales archaeon QH_7_66_37]